MKKYLFLAIIVLASTACTNEETSEKDVVTANDIEPMAAVSFDLITRQTMQTDLVNTWTNGDNLGFFESWDENSNGSFLNFGKQNAKYIFYAESTVKGTLYKNRFWQEGVVDNTIQNNDMVGFVKVADQIHFNSKYTFYSYFPYVSTATRESVPFTLSNAQVQPRPDLWTNETSKYNFTWYVATNITRPADRIVPIGPIRLLPVAEINIIRDNQKLDGYELKSVELRTSNATGGFVTGTLNVNLTSVNGYTDLPFDASGKTGVSSYTVTTTPENFAVSTLEKGRSFAVYMSVNNCTLGKHTIVATFVNGTSTRVITRDYDNADFKIENGHGNILRYYIKVSDSTQLTGTTSDYNGGNSNVNGSTTNDYNGTDGTTQSTSVNEYGGSTTNY